LLSQVVVAVEHTLAVGEAVLVATQLEQQPFLQEHTQLLLVQVALGQHTYQWLLAVVVTLHLLVLR
jgi:hypothetical protein